MTGFFVKPLYSVLSLAVALVLWRATAPDLAALRWAMTAFFVGENFCAANYLIYSDGFNNLPGDVKELFYQRLHEILTGADTKPEFAKLAAADRQAILEILRETKPDLPDYWRR